jgi:hypothetical protein
MRHQRSVDGAVVRLLPALVDKSLVSAAGDTPRYRLLESLRAHAAERLAANGADSDLRQRHATYYLTLAERAAGGLRGPEQRAWLERLMIEQPNLRAGLDHSVGTGDIETALRWISALEVFWDGTGQRREATSGSGEPWRAVSRLPRPPVLPGSPRPAPSSSPGTTKPRCTWPNGQPSSRPVSATSSVPRRPRRWAWPPPTGPDRIWPCPRCTRRCPVR